MLAAARAVGPNFSIDVEFKEILLLTNFTGSEEWSPLPCRSVERQLLAAPLEKGNCVRWDGAKSFPRKNGGKLLMLD